LNIPAAETIEATDDIIRSAGAAANADRERCAKEFHAGNPAFIRDLSSQQFALAAEAYYFGLKVAAVLIASGAKL
jgi:hypothetical protein